MGRCGKTRYRDEIGAKLALASTGRKKKPGTRAEKRFYRCPKCAGFHLTSGS